MDGLVATSRATKSWARSDWGASALRPDLSHRTAPPRRRADRARDLHRCSKPANCSSQLWSRYTAHTPNRKTRSCYQSEPGARVERLPRRTRRAGRSFLSRIHIADSTFTRRDEVVDRHGRRTANPPEQTHDRRPQFADQRRLRADDHQRSLRAARVPSAGAGAG